MLGLNINLSQSLQFFVALVLSISFHEFFHAWSANQLGDSTARRMGRMTLNPLVHFDPLGAIMLVYMAIGGRGIGWGKPVPVNPFNLEGNRRVSMGLTAVAGPFSNLLLATLAAVPLRLGLNLPTLISSFVWTLVVTNVSLAMFNLIPLPPLDGFSVIQGLLGTMRSRSAYEWGERLDRLAPYGPYVLLLLLSLGWFAGLDVLGRILGPPVNAIISLLVG